MVTGQLVCFRAGLRDQVAGTPDSCREGSGGCECVLSDVPTADCHFSSSDKIGPTVCVAMASYSCTALHANQLETYYY